MVLLGALKLNHLIKESDENSQVINAWRCEVEGDKWESASAVSDRYKGSKFIEPNTFLFYLRTTTELLTIQVKYYANSVLIESVTKNTSLGAIEA